MAYKRGRARGFMAIPPRPPIPWWPPAGCHQLQPSHGQRVMALGLATLREGHGNGGATGSLEGKHDDFAMILWCTVSDVRTIMRRNDDI